MKKKTIEEKEKEKEKKIMQLMKYDLKNKIKDLYEKDEINNTHKVSKSNLDLVHIDVNRKYSLNGKQEQEQEQEQRPIIKRRNVKTLSIHISKSPEKYQTMMNNPDEILKTKIFRVVGKKINNFSQTFEEKNNTIIDLFQKFRSKISEIRDQFNCYSNNVELNTNKLKNPIKFINFNEVIIFERKVIEYLEKRILFYMKVINNIESIFIDDNINFKSLNDFYSSIEKENAILKNNDFSVINDKENISSHKSIKDQSNGNININSNRHNEKYNDLQTDQNILNTERNNRVDNKYNKLFLPSLKRLSHNNNQLLNRSTFRNSQLKLNSMSKDKQNKHDKHDIFNVQKPAFLESLKKNKDEQHILNLKESKKSVDKYKIMVDHYNKENIHAHAHNKAIKKISKKNVKIVEHDKDKDKKETRRRKSVAILTVPNYHNLNNVNDYIMNYNSHVPTDKHKNDGDKHRKEDIRHRTRKNQSSKNAVIKKESKKSNILYNIKSVKKKSNLKVNKKDSKKSQISSISKSINKSIKSITTNSEKTKKEIVNEDNDDDDNFSSENSDSDNGNDKEEEDKKSTINDKRVEEEINEISIDNKDPLDDIKYLQNLRNKIKKENYHEIEFLLSEKK